MPNNQQLEQTLNPTHSFGLADVEKYGSIEKALLIKEIRGMQVYKMRGGQSGWVYYSGEALAQKFPYMTGRSIRRRLEELVQDHHLEAEIRNKNKYDQTKSYRLPDIKVPEAKKRMPGVNWGNRGPKDDNDIGQSESSIGQSDQSIIGQNDQPIPSHSSHSPSLSKNQKIENKNEYNRKKAKALSLDMWVT